MVSWKKIGLVTVMEIPITGYFVFLFYYPNIVFPPIGDVFFNNFFLFFIVMIPSGVLIGFLTDNIQEATVIIFTSTIFAYIYAGVLFYFPFLMDKIWTPDLSALYFSFLKITFFLIIPIIIGLLLGTVIGGYLLDRYYVKEIKKEESYNISKLNK